MLRELGRLVRLELSVPDAVCAFLGGAVGGALTFIGWHLLNEYRPTLLDPIRPR